MLSIKREKQKKKKYLSDVVKFKRSRALNVIVSVSVELVELADKHLFRIAISLIFSTPSVVPRRTSWLLPGSFTVVNCVSLYFLKAGSSDGMMSGPSAVRALMSICC